MWEKKRQNGLGDAEERGVEVRALVRTMYSVRFFLLTTATFTLHRHTITTPGESPLDQFSQAIAAQGMRV